MRKQRVSFVVEVNLDPVPGTFDNAKDVEATLRQWGDRFPWYHPTVKYLGIRTVEDVSNPEDNREYQISG